MFAFAMEIRGNSDLSSYATNVNLLVGTATVRCLQSERRLKHEKFRLSRDRINHLRKGRCLIRTLTRFGALGYQSLSAEIYGVMVTCRISYYLSFILLDYAIF